MLGKGLYKMEKVIVKFFDNILMKSVFAYFGCYFIAGVLSGTNQGLWVDAFSLFVGALFIFDFLVSFSLRNFFNEYFISKYFVVSMYLEYRELRDAICGSEGSGQKDSGEEKG